MVLKENWSATAAIVLDFTKPRRVHNCPRGDEANSCYKVEKSHNDEGASSTPYKDCTPPGHDTLQTVHYGRKAGANAALYATAIIHCALMPPHLSPTISVHGKTSTVIYDAMRSQNHSTN